jgi:hypothetical protein
MKWFTGSLQGAQAMKHPVLGVGFLFGEAFRREKFQDFGINGVSVDIETDSFEGAWSQRGLKPEFESAPLPWPP